MLTKLTKIALISAFLSLVLIVDGNALRDRVNTYNCEEDVNTTRLIDSDNDGYYDTYQIHWCDDDIQTVPIMATTGMPINEEEDDSDRNRLRKKPQNPPKKGLIEEYRNIITDELAYDFDKPWDQNVCYFTRYMPARLAAEDASDLTGLSLTVLPNPTSSKVNVSFSLSSNNNVVINVYNQQGVKVAELMNNEVNKGVHEYSYNTAGLSSGIYFIQCAIGTNVITKKLSIVK